MDAFSKHVFESIMNKPIHSLSDQCELIAFLDLSKGNSSLRQRASS